ncbi:MAG TPA: hypothetical protein VHX38_40330 [Pseudonocardiaceae bacterium]|jgi:hypothetical protein|nr:hypothetical protein [Pseudonocardiaceae bacterium]
MRHPILATTALIIGALGITATHATSATATPAESVAAPTLAAVSVLRPWLEHRQPAHAVQAP